MVEWARSTAVRVHAKQRYQGLPYFTAHVEAVVQLLEHAWRTSTWRGELSPTVRAIAYLHDALEDAEGELTVGDLVVHTSPKVVRCVSLLTRPKGSRAETNDAYFQRISTDQTASLVKVADRLANVLASPGTKYASMYLKEREAFEVLRGKSGRSKIAVARESLWTSLDAAYGKLES